MNNNRIYNDDFVLETHYNYMRHLVNACISGEYSVDVNALTAALETDAAAGQRASYYDTLSKWNDEK